MADFDQLASSNPRVKLRFETVDQADTIYDAIQDNFDYLAKWVYWVTENYSREDNYKAISDNYSLYLKGGSYVVCVYYDGQFAGCVDARINDEGNWEVGYWIIEKFAKLGLATDCTEILMKYVSEKQNVERFDLFTAVDNVPSNRIALKLGFNLVGQVRNKRMENHYVKQ
jgi:ribosomal-protein-serine acetyltransferase